MSERPTEERDRLLRALIALEKLQARLDAVERPLREPVAVIGLGCRLPGGIDSPDSFWALLERGGDGIREVPPDRWDVDAWYEPTLGANDTMNTRWGGFIDGIDRFDPGFFELSTREASTMDPQQRLLLEVSWEALENAGIPREKVRGARAAAFVGAMTCDYYKAMATPPARAGSGIAPSILANRLSYFFDLRGPSVTLDSACSSSLVAVHMACQSLRMGESDLALVGGVNVILVPDLTVAAAQAGLMAADGHCKTFDDAADGYVRGEGCVVALLKRLRDAQRDGDRVLALIRGSAVNQDGASNGLTAPSGAAQEAVIRRALAEAGVKPSQIDYVEAHGSGTALGDVIEVQSLAAVLGEGRSPGQRCALGSAKTNVGHLEGAAGVTGLARAVLTLMHGRIPPHPTLTRLNHRIALEETPFYVPTPAEPSSVRPRFAGVSSFGFGGTNAHVVLEAAPPSTPGATLPSRPRQVLPLSARSPRALAALVRRYAEQLEERPDQALEDLCYTASACRTHFEHRVAVIATDVAELRARLRTLELGETASEAAPQASGTRGRGRVLMAFVGGTSPDVQRLRRLQETEPAFREALERADAILVERTGRRWDQALERADATLAERTGRRWEEAIAGRERPRAASLALPVRVALSCAYAALWRSWGLSPEGVLTNDTDLWSAACVADAIDLSSAITLAHIAETYQDCMTHNTETMPDIIKAHIDPLIRTTPINAPRVPIYDVEGDDIRCIVDAAGVRDRIAAALLSGGLRSRPGEEAAGSGDLAGALDGVVRDGGFTIVLEFGLGLEVPDGPASWAWTNGDPRVPVQLSADAAPERLFESLARAYVSGAAVDWDAYFAGRHRPRAWLPTYPFQRQRCWLQPHELRTFSRRP